MGFADGFRCSLPLFQEYTGTIVDYCVLRGTPTAVLDIADVRLYANGTVMGILVERTVLYTQVSREKTRVSRFQLKHFD
jgi:hypothetical protein